jgi:hypothetical protein
MTAIWFGTAGIALTIHQVACQQANPRYHFVYVMIIKTP